VLGGLRLFQVWFLHAQATFWCYQNHHVARPESFPLSQAGLSHSVRTAAHTIGKCRMPSSPANLSAALSPRQLPIISGARPIVVIPLAVIAPYWNKMLLSLSLLVKRASIRSSRQQSAPPTSAPGLKHDSDIFTVDVTTSVQNVHKKQITLLFCRKSLLRDTSRAGSPHDQNERVRIHSALQDLRMSHPHDTPPPPLLLLLRQ
jgi:hypothetical protein